MNLTPAQYQILYQRPHRTKHWLSIYKPKTVFACQVTGTYSSGETDITYQDSITGSISNVYANITVLIGTTDGADDVGRIRYRSNSNGVITFAENNIIWKNGYYLTFLDYVNIEAIFPRIIKDPNNDENVIFYKDDDIAYTNQNTNYGTFPCAGSHRAAFLETGTATLYWDSTGTYNVKGDSLTYDWAFEGGTPTGSSARTPGNVVYTTPGHYKTRLIVSSSSGVDDTTYRYVSIYDRPENGTNVPILNWKLESLSGSRGEGGYTASIKVFSDLGSIEPNALVVIFSDEYYGDTRQSFTGNITMVGYILKDSIQFNYKDGWAEFDIGSVTEVMKGAEGFSVSCESKSTAETWFQLQEMTIKKALYHYLRWHSTVLNVTDFQYTGNDRKFQYFDTDRTSLFDAINSFAEQSFYGETVADRNGKIWVEINPIGYGNPITSISEGMTIQHHDWVGEPNVSLRRTAAASFVEMGGIVYEGADTNGFQALLSNAPSQTPLYRGRSDSPREGLILLSQSQLNKICGNYIANKNSKFEDVTLGLAGNYKNLDIAPQEKLYLMIDENDTTVNESLVGYPFRLMSMDWSYNPELETFYPDTSYEQISTGTSGVTVIIPPIPPDDGYHYPSLDLPPFPSFPPATTTQQLATTVLALEADYGLFYTEDFDSAQPTWLLWNTGIDSADVSYIRSNAATSDSDQRSYVFMTPGGAVYVGIYEKTFHGWIDTIYRAPYIGGEFEKLIDPTWLTTEYTNGGIVGIGYDPGQSDFIAFIVTEDVTVSAATKNMWYGSPNSLTKGADFSFGASNHAGNLTYGNNEWTWDAIKATEEYFFQFDNTGNLIDQSDNMGQGNSTWHWRAGDSAIIVKQYSLTQTNFLRSKDGGRTWDEITLGKIMGPNQAISYDGRYLMGTWDYGVAYKGRSGDGGYSWTALSGLVPGGNFAYAFCGTGESSESRWIAGRGAIYYSTNFGNSWSQKTGNILELFPPTPGASITKFVAFIQTEQ